MQGGASKWGNRDVKNADPDDSINYDEEQVWFWVEGLGLRVEG